MKRMFLMAALAAGAAGCSKSKPETATPAQVTAEQVAEQKQAEKDVQNAEAAVRKGQKPARTAEQNVEDEERNRRR